MEIIDLSSEGISFDRAREASFTRMSGGVSPYQQCSIPELIDLIKNSSSYTQVNSLLNVIKNRISRTMDLSLGYKIIRLIYKLFRDSPLWIKNKSFVIFRSLVFHNNYINLFNKLNGCKLLIDQLKGVNYIHNVYQVETYIENIISYFKMCDIDVIEKSFLNNEGIDIFSNCYILSNNIGFKEVVIEFMTDLIYNNNVFKYLKNDLRENGVLNYLLQNFIQKPHSLTNLENQLFNIYYIISNNIKNINYCREKNLVNYLRNLPQNYEEIRNLIECIDERVVMESEGGSGHEDIEEEFGEEESVDLLHFLEFPIQSTTRLPDFIEWL